MNPAASGGKTTMKRPLQGVTDFVVSLPKGGDRPRAAACHEQEMFSECEPPVPKGYFVHFFMDGLSGMVENASDCWPVLGKTNGVDPAPVH
jgi:hypothetical protein